MEKQKQNQNLAAIEKELAQEAVSLGDPEPQSLVELETFADRRLAESNEWKMTEVNSRINRAVLANANKTEEEITRALESFTKTMREKLLNIAQIDQLCPEAKARAREKIEAQRKARERIKEGKLIQCPRCLYEFTEE